MALSLVFDWSEAHPSLYFPAFLFVVLALGGAVLGVVPAVRGAFPDLPWLPVLPMAPLALLIAYSLLRAVDLPDPLWSARDTPGLGLTMAGVGLILCLQAAVPGVRVVDESWRWVAVALLAGSGVWGLASLASAILAIPDFAADYVLEWLLSLLIQAGLVLLLPLVFAVQLARRRAADFLACLILCGTLVAVLAFASVADSFYAGLIGATAWASLGGVTTLLFLGAAASCATPVVRGLRPALVGAERWLQLAGGLVGLSAIAMTLTAASGLLAISDGAGDQPRTVIATVVALVWGAWALVCRGMLVRSARSARSTALAWAASLAVVNAIQAAYALKDFPWSSVGDEPRILLGVVVALALAPGLPILVFLCLAIPRALSRGSAYPTSDLAAHAAPPAPGQGGHEVRTWGAG